MDLSPIDSGTDLPRADEMLSEGNLKDQNFCGNRGFDESHLSGK
jgi:hypothetical protein